MRTETAKCPVPISSMLHGRITRNARNVVSLRLLKLRLSRPDGMHAVMRSNRLWKMSESDQR